MKEIDDKSINLILCDLPYGTTRKKWDVVIPFIKLWEQYERIIKDNGAIVLTASQPFTSALICYNFKCFKYNWVWDKVSVSNPQLAKIQPLKHHEDICVFGKGKINYYPQGLIKLDKPIIYNSNVSLTEKLEHIQRKKYIKTVTNYPKSIIKFSRPTKPEHPTQKPVALFEYMIKTYTNEGETVLDNCAGVMTTAIACINTSRNYICMEMDNEYYKAGLARINKHRMDS